MPHKHVRRKDALAQPDYNLSPAILAKPLPAFDKNTKVKSKAEKRADETRQLKRKRDRVGTDGYKEDDTPRAFARMMQDKSTATHKRPSSGLDDGMSKKKKRKLEGQKAGTTALHAAPMPKKAAPPAAATADVPKIQPGESLADYSARVDQALPMAGLTRKGTVKIDGVKERKTKNERRLQKMHAAWREEDVRRKEKLEERLEEEEEEREEKEAKYGGQSIALPSHPTRKAKRKRTLTEAAESSDEDDPWAVLDARKKVQRNLHDVVQAPPEMKVVPTEKFKVRAGARVDVADVPQRAGSLKRREELGGERRGVIEAYRALMRGRGAEAE
ncbi:hypothetical protein LTR08_001506 [Meristemomyces frigidus]|nr:hypothetical protein LTR08_001506 [Meristemomyces frigidus]